MSKYRNSKIDFTPTALETLHPVPSDIDIAQAQMEHIKPVTQVAEELGHLRDWLDMHAGGGRAGPAAGRADALWPV